MPKAKAKKPRKPKLPACITAPTYKNAAAMLKKVDPDVLREVLLASGDMRFEALANDLERVPYSTRNKYTLTELCGQRKIKLPDVANLFAEWQLAHAKLKQMEHAPDILESNAIAAIGRKQQCGTCGGDKRILKTCAVCKGKGKIKAEEIEVPCLDCMEAGYVDNGPCLTCAETGWVQSAGDPNALKVFADSAGLTSKSGPMVNVNLNQFNGAGSFEDLMARAEKPRGNIIEATRTDT